MDELNELKRLWKNQKESFEKPIKGVDLDKAIQEGSQQHIRRFQRNLFIELIIGCVIVLIIAFLMIRLPFSEFGLYMIFPFIVFCASLVLYAFRFVDLKQAVIQGEFSVRDTLTLALIKMRGIADAYLVLNLLLMFIMFPLVILYSLNQGDWQIVNAFTDADVSSLAEPLIIVVLSLVLMALVYPILKFYMRMMFKRYIRALESNLQELKENGC